MNINVKYILFKCKHKQFEPEADLIYEKTGNGGYNIKVYLGDLEVGTAEGYRWAVAGNAFFYKFTMYEFTKNAIPKKYFFNDYLFAERISGAGSAGRGAFPRSIYLGMPPKEFKTNLFNGLIRKIKLKFFNFSTKILKT
jgi:hypothetical protein